MIESEEIEVIYIMRDHRMDGWMGAHSPSSISYVLHYLSQRP